MKYGEDYTVEQLRMKRGQDPPKEKAICSLCRKALGFPNVRLIVYDKAYRYRATIGRLCFSCLRKIGLGGLLE